MSFENEYKRSQELEYRYAMPEVSEEIKNTFTKIEYPLVLGCGDDRGCTDESAAALTALGLPMDRAFARLFGGKFGAANILAVAATAQHGPDFVQHRLGTDFYALSEELSQRAKQHGVYMLTHSAQSNEDNPAQINRNSEKAVGCARIAALGQVNDIAANNQLAIRVGEADAEAIFGNLETTISFPELAEKFAQTSNLFYGDNPKSFAIDRGVIIKTNTQAMVLKGSHARSEQAKHVINLEWDELSDANEASARQIYYYNNDVVVVAAALIKSYPELELDPNILINTMLLDAAATRTALAAGDGTPDPQRIESLRNGGGREALTYLHSLN